MEQNQNEQDLIQAETIGNFGVGQLEKIVTKDEIVQGIRTMVKSGVYDNVRLGVNLKRMKDGIEEALKDKEVKDIIFEASEPYKGQSVLGAKISVGPTYTAYDFTGCGDDYLDELYSILAEVKEKINTREERLKLLLKDVDNNKTIRKIEKSVEEEVVIKTLPKLIEIEHGNMVTLKPPVKKQTIGLKYLKV